MNDTQHKIITELEAAAEVRHSRTVRVNNDGFAVTVRSGDKDEQLLEEYIWNSAGSLLIRVCYLVWEHIVGEDHEWGRFSTQRQAEQRIAALFSTSSLGTGEYYIARLYTTNALE